MPKKKPAKKEATQRANATLASTLGFASDLAATARLTPEDIEAEKQHARDMREARKPVWENAATPEDAALLREYSRRR